MAVYHLVRISENRKTGPIPVVTASKTTCPTACPLRFNGCYAETGPLGRHWAKVSDGKRGVSLEALSAQLRALPRHQLWRYGQAGDLPGDGASIDAKGLDVLVQANKSRRGFGFTHYDPTDTHNASCIKRANTEGFIINLSANNIEHADLLKSLGVGPVATVLPSDATKSFWTPGGNFVAICPATQRGDVTCATCAICANPSRKAIIGFPAHGTGKKKAHAVFFAKVI